MLLFCQIAIALLTLSGLPLLRRAWRRRACSMVLLVTASELYMWELVLYPYFPAAYWNYLWYGSLHLGAVTFRPPFKPNLDWMIGMILATSFLVFYVEEVQKKKRRKRSQAGDKFL